jgi:RNA polymerase sigma-70 factor (ECF subfamily)
METDPPQPLDDVDAELLRAAQSAPEGDLRAFEELVRRHQARIRANCRYLTCDDNNVEDLTQEVFLKAYFGLAKFEHRSTFRHWLKRIKVNHCLNHMRRGAGNQMVDIEETSPEDSPILQEKPQAEVLLEQMDERDQIKAVLDRLPDTLRVPLVMCDMDELSYEEIASALRLGLSAVKMRIKRARERFREIYTERGAISRSHKPA